MGVKDIVEAYKNKIKEKGRSKILESGEYRSNMSEYLEYAKEMGKYEPSKVGEVGKFISELLGAISVAELSAEGSYMVATYTAELANYSPETASGLGMAAALSSYIAYLCIPIKKSKKSSSETIFGRAPIGKVMSKTGEAYEKLSGHRHAKKVFGKEEAKKYEEMEKIFGLSEFFREVEKNKRDLERAYERSGPEKIAKITPEEVQSQYQNKIEALENLRKELEDSVLKLGEGKTDLVPTSINENKESELSIEYQPLEKVLKRRQKRK